MSVIGSCLVTASAAGVVARRAVGRTLVARRGFAVSLTLSGQRPGGAAAWDNDGAERCTELLARPRRRASLPPGGFRHGHTSRRTADRVARPRPAARDRRRRERGGRFSRAVPRRRSAGRSAIKSVSRNQSTWPCRLRDRPGHDSRARRHARRPDPRPRFPRRRPASLDHLLDLVTMQAELRRTSGRTGAWVRPQLGRLYASSMRSSPPTAAPICSTRQPRMLSATLAAMAESCSSWRAAGSAGRSGSRSPRGRRDPQAAFATLAAATTRWRCSPVASRRRDVP